MKFLALSGILFIFAGLSASTNYVLKSYSIGAGGSANTSSTNYSLQASLGEQSNGTTSSTNNVLNNGSINAEQLNIPPAPTLSNGNNTYYNMLGIIINTANNPADTTYAVAVSTNNFTTTQYLQADSTLGASPVFQSYTAWGGATGSYISDLLPSTAYQVKVSAMEGQFTNTNYGPQASISTVAPSISLALSTSQLNLGSLLPGNVATSNQLTTSFATNAVAGGTVYVYGQYAGLDSLAINYLINAVSANLASLSNGFGLQASNPTETSGGPLTINSPYNGTADVVGADSSTPQAILSSPSAIYGGSASVVSLAKASTTTPAASDYQEILTFEASANY